MYMKQYLKIAIFLAIFTLPMASFAATKHVKPVVRINKVSTLATLNSQLALLILQLKAQQSKEASTTNALNIPVVTTTKITTAKCTDNTYSTSENLGDACAYHGGVNTYYSSVLIEQKKGYNALQDQAVLNEKKKQDDILQRQEEINTANRQAVQDALDAPIKAKIQADLQAKIDAKAKCDLITYPNILKKVQDNVAQSGGGVNANQLEGLVWSEYFTDLHNLGCK